MHARLAVAVFGLAWCVLSAARAVGDAPPSIALSPALDPAIEGTAERVIASRPDLRLSTSEARARFVLGGRVARLEAHRVGSALELRCEVALVLADSRGSIRATLHGGATARGTDGRAELARAALFAAVRSALRPVGAELH